MDRHKFFAIRHDFRQHYPVTKTKKCKCGVPVMIHAADYRAKAADCARRAEDAQDDYHRKNFLELAAMWSEMAAKAEGRIASDAEPANGQVLDDALATIKDAGADRS
jgi:hypothetical protein